jgi:peptidoglycan/LPS O-acetylase OafA/YrhL
MSQRFEELDGLRGIAAMWVVVFHLTFGVHHHWLSGDPAFADLVAPGGFNVRGLMGVDLFFVISGFVITLTAERCATIGQFARARFARLFPAYWFAVLLTATVEALDPIPKSSVSFGQVLVNLTMLNAFVRVPSVDPSYWTLAVELAFYAMTALLIASGNLSRVVWIGFVWVVVTSFTLYAFRVSGAIIPWRLDTAFAMSHAGLFYAGILFYRIRRDGWSPAAGALLAVCFITRCLLLPWDLRAIEVGIFITFGLTVAGRIPFLSSRFLVYLGAISYSVYLVHQVTGFHIQLMLERTGMPAWANFAATVALLILLASGMTFFVERPASAALCRAFSRQVRGRADDRHRAYEA